MMHGFTTLRKDLMKEYFEYIFPFLLILYILLWIGSWGGRQLGINRKKKPVISLITIILSAILCLLPIGELSIGAYILSFNPSFSVGIIALLIILLTKELSGRELLREKDLLWFSIWNLAVSLILYSSSLGFIGTDIYGTGYSFSLIFVITAVLTLALIFIKSRLYIIFTGYIVVFNLKILPSDNFFDHITDGVLFFASVIMIMRFILRNKGVRLEAQPEGKLYEGI